MTKSGDTGTDADSYTITFTLKDPTNYGWIDGGSATIVWSIEQTSVNTYYTALETARGYEITLNEYDYTIASWNDLLAAISSVSTLTMDDPINDITDAIQTIENAKLALVDITELWKKVNTANEKTQADYTTKSWNDLTIAKDDLTDLDSVRNLKEDQTAIDIRAYDINSATAALVNITALKSLLTSISAEDYQANDYSEVSFETLQSAVSSVLEGTLYTNGTKMRVENAITALTNAQNGLVSVNKTINDETVNLYDLLAQADTLNEEDYSPEKWADFIEVKNSAESAARDGTYIEVSTSIDALMAAMITLSTPDQTPINDNIWIYAIAGGVALALLLCLVVVIRRRKSNE